MYSTSRCGAPLEPLSSARGGEGARAGATAAIGMTTGAVLGMATGAVGATATGAVGATASSMSDMTCAPESRGLRGARRVRLVRGEGRGVSG
jgi:hypothetical protein